MNYVKYRSGKCISICCCRKAVFKLYVHFTFVCMQFYVKRYVFHNVICYYLLLLTCYVFHNFICYFLLLLTCYVFHNVICYYLLLLDYLLMYRMVSCWVFTANHGRRTELSDTIPIFICMYVFNLYSAFFYSFIQVIKGAFSFPISDTHHSMLNVMFLDSNKETV
jgi:hypothetical protein